jgi:DNA-binding transcriptional ArsR family regulator
MSAIPEDDLPDISRLASLLSDPGRGRMLLALLDGGMHPASDLAGSAGLSLPAASNHLARLLAGNVVKAERAGRHRYYSLANGAIAHAIEALSAAAHAGDGARPGFRPKGTPELRQARTCYDHLAGRLGVMLTEALQKKKYLRLDEESKSYKVSKAGRDWFCGALAIDAAVFEQRRRPVAKACLDWSERRYHLAGALGAALCHAFLKRGLVKYLPRSRALTVTAAGRAFFGREIGWEG